jgi:hypothetical protein
VAPKQQMVPGSSNLPQVAAICIDIYCSSFGLSRMQRECGKKLSGDDIRQQMLLTIERRSVEFILSIANFAGY